MSKQNLTDLAGYLGGIVLVYFGVGYVLNKIPVAAPAAPAPSPVPGLSSSTTLSASHGAVASTSAALSPAAASTQPPSIPQLVQGDPLPMIPGQPYRVTLNTHGAASALASDSRIQSEAQNRGFTNISASQSKPAGWPGAANGSYYVSAIYNGPAKSQQRSEGNFLGSVDIVEAWVG